MQNHTFWVHSQTCTQFHTNSISHKIQPFRNFLKQYQNLRKFTNFRFTLKIVTILTQILKFVIFSQNCTKTYAKSHICGALSKQYKLLRNITHLRYSFKTVQKPMQNHICCALSKMYNILRKITHLRCTLKTLQTPRQNSTIAVSPLSPPHPRSNHAFLGAVSKQYETNFTRNHTFGIF